jgi:hypothetical protein
MELRAQFFSCQRRRQSDARRAQWGYGRNSSIVSVAVSQTLALPNGATGAILPCVTRISDGLAARDDGTTAPLPESEAVRNRPL